MSKTEMPKTILIMLEGKVAPGWCRAQLYSHSPLAFPPCWQPGAISSPPITQCSALHQKWGLSCRWTDACSRSLALLSTSLSIDRHLAVQKYLYVSASFFRSFKIWWEKLVHLTKGWFTQQIQKARKYLLATKNRGLCPSERASETPQPPLG